MAMALTLTVLVTQFRQLGLSQAVVQRVDLRWSQVNALFWINTGAGIGLAMLVALSGFPLAAFYGQPQLVPICAVLGIGFAISGLSVQHGALLNRAMQFRQISVRNLAAGGLSSGCAIVAAVLGLGVWSLVIQSISALVFATVLNWWAVPWRPSRPRQVREALPLLAFGAHVSIAGLFHTLSRQGDNIIIGKFLDAGTLGLYTRAYSLLMLPLRQLKTPVQAVMVPALAALQQEPQRYRRAYRTSLTAICYAGMPIVVILAVSAHEVIFVALGDQWTAAAPIFQFLAVAGFVQLVSTTTGWIYTSTGRGRAYAGWALASAVVTVAGFAVGVQWGGTGVAASYALTQTVLLVPAFYFACKTTPVAFGDPFRAMARPSVVALAVLAGALAARALASPELPAIVRLGVVLAGAVAAWVIALAVWRTARVELVGLAAVLRQRRRRPRAGKSAGAVSARRTDTTETRTRRDPDVH